VTKKPHADKIKAIESVALKKAAQKSGFLMDTKCFYIVQQGSKAGQDDLALTVSKQDKYAPKTTGVYNVYGEKATADNLAQQWHYDVSEGLIMSNFYKNKVLSEGANANLFMYKNRNIKNQKFSVDFGTGRVYNRFTENSVTLGKKDYLEPGTETPEWNLIMDKEAKNKNEQHWEVMLCPEKPENNDSDVDALSNQEQVAEGEEKTPNPDEAVKPAAKEEGAAKPAATEEKAAKPEAPKEGAAKQKSAEAAKANPAAAKPPAPKPVTQKAPASAEPAAESTKAAQLGLETIEWNPKLN